MAGTRLPSPAAISPSATHFAQSRPDATIDIFTLPTLTRTTFPPPTPTSHPSHLVLTNSSPPLPFLSTSSNTLHLATTTLPSPQPPVTALATAANHLLAVSGNAPTHILTLLRARDGKILNSAKLHTHHRSPVTAIALSSNASLAAVCSQAVSLVHPRTGALLRSFTGHSAPVSAAIFLPAQPRLLTASPADRFISVWDVDLADSQKPDPAVKRRRKTHAASQPSSFPAIATLSAPEPGVVALCVDQFETTGASVAATLVSGNVAVWRNWTEKSAGTKPAHCSFVITNAPQGAKSAPVLAVAFGKVGVLTVVYGSALKPSVFTLNLNDVDDDRISLPPCETDVLVNKAVAKSKGKDHLVKKTAAAEASSMPAMPRKEEKRKANGTIVDSDEDQDDAEGAAEENEQDVDDSNDDEPSIQQKLIALGISKDGTDVSGFHDLPMPAANDKSVIGSRVNILMQAIRSQDPRLFDETIDKMRDRKLIRNTVERLPHAVAAGEFLDILVDRLQRYPTKAELLVRWIREVLHEHTGALISQQKNKALVALIEIVNERTQALEGLSRLQGRLELVVTRADKLKRAGARGKTGVAFPRAEYEEEEGSEDEEEDDSSDDSSDASGSEIGSEDAEDETGEFGSDESSGEEDSDEEMEEVTRTESAATAKGPASTAVKMNGHHAPKSAEGDSSDSEESSDEGD